MRSGGVVDKVKVGTRDGGGGVSGQGQARQVGRMVGVRVRRTVTGFRSLYR